MSAVEIELREVTSHWEGDIVVGKGKKNGLVTLLEWVTGFTKIRYVEDCGSTTVNREMIAVANEADMESVTLDNGKEFAKHEDCCCIFCRPLQLMAAWHQ